MSVAIAGRCRNFAYVFLHRQSRSPVSRSEPESAGEPERLRVVRLVEVELLVLEPHVHVLENVDARAGAPREGAVAVVVGDVAERCRNARVDVVPVVAGLREELEPVADRERADEVRREAVRLDGQPRVGEDFVVRASASSTAKYGFTR